MKGFKSLIVVLLSLIVLSGCNIDKAVKKVDNTISSISEADKSETPRIKNSQEDIGLINAKTNDENYAFINDNKTQLTPNDQNLLSQKGNNQFWVVYPNLDQYGRAGKVTALITYEAVKNHSSKAQKRPSFDSDVHVAGEYKDGVYNPQKQTWKGNKSNNKILQLDGYRGYIYNKSHSLAWSLGGDMETHNLTLGTRAQNVGSNKNPEGGGMGYPETQIRNAMYDKPSTKVFYEVTPVYNGNELVPRGTHVRAYSINDNGKTININVWIANKQKGVQINYKDGTYKY
ncbi:TPA: DNA/RNA non-specific endonuclease [Staphylococcus aureus]|nr:DNA/RNA non-specific endonuclease [Staphylococcus aureus]